MQQSLKGVTCSFTELKLVLFGGVRLKVEIQLGERKSEREAVTSFPVHSKVLLSNMFLRNLKSSLRSVQNQ